MSNDIRRTIEKLTLLSEQALATPPKTQQRKLDEFLAPPPYKAPSKPAPAKPAPAPTTPATPTPRKPPLGGLAKLAGRTVPGLALWPSDLGPKNIPQHGPQKGSEINPITGKGWTGDDLRDYEADPLKYATGRRPQVSPVSPKPGVKSTAEPELEPETDPAAEKQKKAWRSETGGGAAIGNPNIERQAEKSRPSTSRQPATPIITPTGGSKDTPSHEFMNPIDYLRSVGIVDENKSIKKLTRQFENFVKNFRT